MGQIILITGGAKSGKSAFAEQLAISSGINEITYIATQANQILDQESLLRIQAHQARRPGHWHTLECYQDLGQRTDFKLGQGCLLDCLTLWITNLVFDWARAGQERGGDLDSYLENLTKDQRASLLAWLETQVEDFLHLVRQEKMSLWIVTNEVGFGIVPPTALGRLFRDLFGQINQFVASSADQVYLVLSGIPLKIK